MLSIPWFEKPRGCKQDNVIQSMWRSLFLDPFITAQLSLIRTKVSILQVYHANPSIQCSGGLDEFPKTQPRFISLLMYTVYPECFKSHLKIIFQSFAPWEIAIGYYMRLSLLLIIPTSNTIHGDF